MPGPGKFCGRKGSGQLNLSSLSSVARENAVALPADSPVLAMFRAAALKLNERQDRHERLVKHSRDITIESKRIIFLLHSSITKEAYEKTLIEANERLQKLINGPIRAIGLELEHSPAYLHSRAVTAGFQEYVEARTLFSLMATKRIITYSEVLKELEFCITDNGNQRNVFTMLLETDYMLGLADLTGELMRKAINSISCGDSEECLYACQVVRDLYTGYLGLTGSRVLMCKLSTSYANVMKVEQAAYALHLRGGVADGPAPAPLLGAMPPVDWELLDEGYY